jgi:hypothetical protein
MLERQKKGEKKFFFSDFFSMLRDIFSKIKLERKKYLFFFSNKSIERVIKILEE